jgi:hypothetical protein
MLCLLSFVSQPAQTTQKLTQGEGHNESQICSSYTRPGPGHPGLWPGQRNMSDVAGTLEAVTVEAPETGEATVEPTAEPVGATAVAPTSAPVTGGLVRQWAISAVASSEYGTSDWSAMQTTGAPNTPECGDYVTAWAAASSDTEEWVELTYATFVHPTEVNIVQTYNPAQVVKVELIDNVSGYHVVYTGEPKAMGECPYVLSIPVESADYVVGGIRITIDQSVLQDWNEIDAVELVGTPAEE